MNGWIQNAMLRDIAAELAVKPAGAYVTVPVRLIEEAQPRHAPERGTYAHGIWVFAFTMAGKAVPEDPLLQEVLADFAASQRIEVLEHVTGRESRELVFRNLVGAERGPAAQPRHPVLFFAVLDVSREARRQGAELWIEPPLLSRLLAETFDSPYAGAWSPDLRFFNGVRVRGWAREGEGIHWLRPKPDVPAEVLARV